MHLLHPGLISQSISLQGVNTKLLQIISIMTSPERKPPPGSSILKVPYGVTSLQRKFVFLACEVQTSKLSGRRLKKQSLYSQRTEGSQARTHKDFASVASYY